MKLNKQSISGILICILIAAIATILGGIKLGNVSLEVIGAPVFAILIGMIITLVHPLLRRCFNNNHSGWTSS